MSFPRQFRIALCAVLLAALAASSLIADDDGADRGSIRVGGGDNFAPYHFKDDSGEPAGFDIDLVRAVGRVMGIDLEIELGPWKTQRLALESGEIDMLAGLSLSKEREEMFLFSRPYLLTQYKIFVQADDTTIHNAGDLEGKSIIVQRDGVMEDFVRTRGYTENPVQVSTAREGLQLLASGREDCYLTGEYRGLFVRDELGLDHLTRRGQPLFIADYGFAVTTSRPELVERLNLGLDIVKASGEYDRLVQKWFGVYDPAPITRKLMLYGAMIILPLLFILILSLAWTRTLRKKVAKQTQALQQELRKREQLEDELVQARKMEAIGKLAGGVAHDFNNILLAIQGFGEMIRDDLARDDPVRRNVEQILKASGRATSLTNQMLAFSRRQLLQPRIVDLNRAVSDIRRLIERLIGTEIDLRLNLEPHLGKVRVDPGQFDQVIVNLMMNAKDALPDGGTITITTSNVTFARDSIPNRSDIPPGRYVSLEISDTGHGITREDLARIFEPFFTTRKQGEGTGLGLSAVHGIVKQSGGYLHVESEPGRGATFRIFLPRDDSRAEKVPDQ